jgi:hypothetical protein
MKVALTGSDQFRVVSPSPCKVFGQSANPRGSLDLRVNTVRKSRRGAMGG